MIQRKLFNFLKNLIMTLGLVGIVMIPLLTTSSYAAGGYTLGSVIRKSISAWYLYILRICIFVYSIAYLIIVLKLLAYKTPEKITILKRSLFHFFFMFIVIFFLHYIMIAIIEINQKGLDIARSLSGTLSGIDMETDEYDLYETVLSKAYELAAIPGTIGLFMYLLLVYYTYKFAFVYAKRFINIIVLVLLAPIIFVVSTIKKIIMGISDGTIVKWFKEFIFNVIIQTFHAIFYATLIGLALRLSDNDENLIGLAIVLILFGFIFKIDAIIRKIFDFVGGSTKINSSKTVGKAINITGRAVSGGISGIGNAAETFGDNLEQKGLKDGLKQTASDAGGFFKNKIHEAGQSIKQLPGEVKQKAIMTGMEIKDKTVSAYANAKAEAKDFKKIMRGERVKENLTAKELVAATHDLSETKGLMGLRNKVQRAGSTASKKTGNLGKLTKKRFAQLYATVDGRTKRAIIEAREDFNRNVDRLENTVEIARKVPRVCKKIINYFKRKKIKVVKNQEGMNVDITNTMMMVVDTEVSPEEFMASVRKELGEGFDIGVYTFENIGAQTFLSPAVGVPRMGMAVLAEEKYEEIATHRIEEAVTGEKRPKTRKIKKPSSRKSKKAIKGAANSIQKNETVFRKTYKFSRFNPDTARKINNRMLQKSREQNRYLIVINKAYDDIEINALKPRGRIIKKVTEVAKEVRATRKSVVRTVRQIKLEQKRALERYRNLERQTRRIEIAHNVGHQFMTARNTIKLGFKQIDAMTPGQIALRKMIKEGRARELSGGLIAVRKTATVQEKVRATGLVKAEDQKLVLQFVVGKSGELLKQVVSTDGKIVKPATETPVVATNVKKKKTKEQTIPTTQSNVETPSVATNVKKAKQTEQSIPITQSNVETPSVVMNMEPKEQTEKAVSEEPIVQKIVTADGKIVQQVVNADGTIDAKSYQIVDKGGEKLVAQVQSMLTNEELGLAETATAEERVAQFETLIKDIKRETDTKPLLEQVVEQSTPQERELDEILVSAMEVTGVTSLHDVRQMHFGEEVTRSKEELHKAKMFEQAITDRMISTGVITPVEAEDKDLMADAFHVLNTRVETLTEMDSADILMDTATEMERTRAVEKLINKGEFTIQNPPTEKDVDAQIGKLSDLVLGLAKNYVEETTKYPRKVLEQTAMYMEEVFENAAEGTKTEAELAYENKLKKAEKQWAKEHGKAVDKNIAEKYKRKEKGEDDEKSEMVKISLNFYGAVMTQGQVVTLSNRHSIKDFYDKANKLEGASLKKTQEKFLQDYGEKLEAMQLMPFTFAKHPIEEMDEWSIYIVTNKEDISKGEKEKKDSEVNEDIQETINLYFVEIKKVFTDFLIENEIISFEQLYHSDNSNKKKELIRRLSSSAFGTEKEEGIAKAALIVDVLDSDKRFRSIMKKTGESILAKQEEKLAQTEGEESRKRAKATTKVMSKKDAEESAAATITKKEADEIKDAEKDALMRQVLNDAVAKEEEEAQATTSEDLRQLLENIQAEGPYVMLERGNKSKQEQRATLKFKTDEGDAML